MSQITNNYEKDQHPIHFSCRLIDWYLIILVLKKYIPSVPIFYNIMLQRENESRSIKRLYKKLKCTVITSQKHTCNQEVHSHQEAHSLQENILSSRNLFRIKYVKNMPLIPFLNTNCKSFRI